MNKSGQAPEWHREEYKGTSCTSKATQNKLVWKHQKVKPPMNTDITLCSRVWFSTNESLKCQLRATQDTSACAAASLRASSRPTLVVVG